MFDDSNELAAIGQLFFMMATFYEIIYSCKNSINARDTLSDKMSNATS